MSRLAARARRLVPILWLALAAFAPAAEAAELARLVRTSGPVDVRHAGRWEPAHPNAALESGDSVRTGAQASATLRLATGTVVEMAPWTALELNQDSVITAQTGKLWARFKKVFGQPAKIRTPTLLALIRGTALSVDVAPGRAEVEVFEGRVEVGDRSGHSALVEEGLGIVAEATGLGILTRLDAAALIEGKQFIERSAPLFESWTGGRRPRGPVPTSKRLSPKPL